MIKFGVLQKLCMGLRRAPIVLQQVVGRMELTDRGQHGCGRARGRVQDRGGQGPGRGCSRGRGEGGSCARPDADPDGAPVVMCE